MVNQNSLVLFNKLMSQNRDFMLSHALKYSEVETDSYQGKLQEFIMDLTEKIMQDSSKMIQRQLQNENCR